MVIKIHLRSKPASHLLEGKSDGGGGGEASPFVSDRDSLALGLGTGLGFRWVGFQYQSLC